MKDREIYPATALKLVACEISFPPVPRFDSSEGQADLYDALRDRFPIPGPPPQMNFELGPAGASQKARGVRFLDRQSGKSIVILPNSVTMETSRYTRFEEFLAVLREALEAAHAIGKIAGLQRIGLRYLNEIDVPGLKGVSGWAEYVAPELLAAPALYSDRDIAEFQGGMQLSLSDDRLVGFRFGLLNTPAVNPVGPLRIERSPTGPYFLIDIDSAWTMPQGEMPLFDVEAVIATLEQLHDPVRDIFERSITNKLRNDVLRRDPA